MTFGAKRSRTIDHNFIDFISLISSLYLFSMTQSASRDQLEQEIKVNVDVNVNVGSDTITNVTHLPSLDEYNRIERMHKSLLSSIAERSSAIKADRLQVQLWYQKEIDALVDRIFAK